MILDSSALIAIVADEPEQPSYTRAIAAADRVRISATTLVEVFSVLDRRPDPAHSRRLDRLLAQQHVVVEPFTEPRSRIAREAYRDFGRGSGHPAGLNLGDCFAYALAKDADEPLLYKGNGFGHTDVRSVFPGGRVPG